MLKIENLTKQFGNNVIIDEFNYECNEPKIIAIIGQSGSGKSTLLNMIGLLDKPTKGRIIIENQAFCKPTSMYATKIRREKISYLFQNYALCENETIYYNLNMALKYTKIKDKTKKMKEALQKVNLNIDLKTKIHILSGGQQQRVAIARLLLKPSKIILCDEPTGNLDEKNGQVIFDLLQSCVKAGKIVFIATHDKDIANQCDEIINLDCNNETNKII